MTVTEAAGGRRPSAWISRLAARPDANFLVAVVGVAFLLRLVFVMAVQRGNFALNDMFFYHSVASMLADGKGFATIDGRPFGQWPPGYPFLLSFLYRFTGPSPVSAEVLNALIGTAAVVLVYGVALRAFGSVEAKFCAIAMALLPGQIYFADTVMSEPLFSLLLLATLWFIVTRRPEPRTAIIIGLLIGASTLTRGEGPMMVLIPLAAWWPKVPRRRLAELIAIVLGVTALCVVPWTARNYATFHRLIPVSTNFGSTFWAGHNPKATGEQTYPTPADTADAGPVNARDYQIKQAAVLNKAAKQWISDHPLSDLALIPWKLLGLTRGDGDVIYYWINKVSTGEKPLSKLWAGRLAAIADLGWYALLTMFIASIAVFGRSMLRNSVLRGIAAYFSAMLILYGVVLYGQFRYHVPFEPMMLLACAPLAAQLVAVRNKRVEAQRAEP